MLSEKERGREGVADRHRGGERARWKLQETHREHNISDDFKEQIISLSYLLGFYFPSSKFQY